MKAIEYYYYQMFVVVVGIEQLIRVKELINQVKKMKGNQWKIVVVVELMKLIDLIVLQKLLMLMLIAQVKGSEKGQVVEVVESFKLKKNIYKNIC